jgi:GT2 family glycosyltransferase
LWRLLCAATGLDTRFSGSALFCGMRYAALPPADEMPVDVVCGVCLFVERRLWDRLGGFSPAFFMYGEDDDLCLRAARLGYSSALLAGLTIVHHGSGTEPDQERKLCQLLAARSLILRAYLGTPARQTARALLLLRPFLGRHLAKPELRPLWRNVWRRRGQWRAGRFA